MRSMRGGIIFLCIYIHTMIYMHTHMFSVRCAHVFRNVSKINIPWPWPWPCPCHITVRVLCAGPLLGLRWDAGWKSTYRSTWMLDAGNEEAASETWAEFESRHSQLKTTLLLNPTVDEDHRASGVRYKHKRHFLPLTGVSVRQAENHQTFSGLQAATACPFTTPA